MKRSIISLFIIIISVICLSFAVAAEDKPFSDIKTDCWYTESVEYCYDHGYMSGVAEGVFSPSGNLTRAMTVQIFYSMNIGEKQISGALPFTDVTADKWFYNAVDWAYASSVTSGTSADKFSPNTNVSRQDFYVLLYNYTVRFPHNPDSNTAENLLNFTDSTEISDYAVNAMNWAVYNGFLSGYSDGTLKPKASITRAEITSVIARYDRVLGHKWQLDGEKTERSCTADGYALFVCTECSASKPVTYKQGHVNYLSRSIEGSCIAQGSDEYTCMNCSVVTAKATSYGTHNYVRTKIIKPTRKEQGYIIYTCTHCSGTSYSNYVPPLGRTEGWDSNYDGKLTIDEYFGSYDIVDFLNKHQYDYVGTPYVSLYKHRYDPWMLIHNKGEYPDSPGMNCTGFVASVIIRCGGNMNKLNKPSTGSYANAYNWHRTITDNNIFYYSFTTVNQALNSGLMQKGDVVMFLPGGGTNPDYHLGIYWGNSSNNNLFWHSTGRTSYNAHAGVTGLKNQITGMASGTPYSKILVMPLQR